MYIKEQIVAYHSVNYSQFNLSNHSLRIFQDSFPIRLAFQQRKTLLQNRFVLYFVLVSQTINLLNNSQKKFIDLRNMLMKWIITIVILQVCYMFVDDNLGYIILEVICKSFLFLSIEPFYRSGNIEINKMQNTQKILANNDLSVKTKMHLYLVQFFVNLSNFLLKTLQKPHIDYLLNNCQPIMVKDENKIEKQQKIKKQTQQLDFLLKMEQVKMKKSIARKNKQVQGENLHNKQYNYSVHSQDKNVNEFSIQQKKHKSSKIKQQFSIKQSLFFNPSSHIKNSRFNVPQHQVINEMQQSSSYQDKVSQSKQNKTNQQHQLSVIKASKIQLFNSHNKYNFVEQDNQYKININANLSDKQQLKLSQQPKSRSFGLKNLLIPENEFDQMVQNPLSPSPWSIIKKFEQSQSQKFDFSKVLAERSIGDQQPKKQLIFRVSEQIQLFEQNKMHLEKSRFTFYRDLIIKYDMFNAVLQIRMIDNDRVFVKQLNEVCIVQPGVIEFTFEDGQKLFVRFASTKQCDYFMFAIEQQQNKWN